MTTIRIVTKSSPFAENKDIAKAIRIEKIIPILQKNGDVVLDFQGVEGATQSFVHAMISDIIRKYGNEVLDHISFKNCNDTIKSIISIVVDYMQESE